MPLSPGGSTPRAGFWVRWSAMAALLCLLDFVLSAFTVDGPISVSAATSGMRWALMAQECALLSLVAVIPAIPSRRRWRMPLAMVMAAIIVTGWVAFSTIGRFPGLDAVAFLMTVPGQAVQHLVELRPAAIPVLFLGSAFLGWLIDLVAHQAERRFDPRPRIALVVVVTTLFITSCAWSVIAGITFSRSPREIFEPTTGVNYRVTRRWRTLHVGNAGPISGLLLSALPVGNDQSSVLPSDTSVRVERIPRKFGELATIGTPSHHWNVLLIEVESMRADVLSAWGGPLRVMPTVEQIATESRRYLDTYTTATQTDLAVLVPLSGQYPLRDVTLRAYPARSNYPKVLLYDVLAPSGWRAGVFSSQNEEWWGMVNFLRSPSLDTLLHAQNYTGTTYLPKYDIGFARFVRNAKRSGKIDDHETVTEALQWLTRDRGKPFFLYLNLQSSHLPYQTPATAARRFGKGTPSFPILFGRYPIDSAEVVHNEYRNALAYADDQIARVRSALIADGRWDSTVVVITGDHGQAFYEHHELAGHANSVYQELVKVPLVIRAPALAAGDDRRPASHVDIAPTIIDLLGLPDQPAWQGVSLVGDPPPSDRPRFFMVQSPLAHRIGVVSGQWKMVRDIREAWTSLTRVDDAGEGKDWTPQFPDTAKMMLALLDTWRAVQLNYYGSAVTPALQFPPRVTERTAPLKRLTANSAR